MIEESTQNHIPSAEERQQARQKLANLIGRLLAHFWLRRDERSRAVVEDGSEPGSQDSCAERPEQSMPGLRCTTESIP